MESSDGNLEALPGIEHVTDFGQLQELRIGPGADTQDVLRALIERGRVAHFELARPSLHDIFVRIARPETAEADSNTTG
jgi:ABC-2 type transport system ATP-binding protein